MGTSTESQAPRSAVLAHNVAVFPSIPAAAGYRKASKVLLKRAESRVTALNDGSGGAGEGGSGGVGMHGGIRGGGGCGGTGGADGGEGGDCG